MAIINARIPDALDESLSTIAKTMDRSKSYIILKAIENYIREELEDIEDAEIALERIRNPNRKFLTLEEVNEILKEHHNV